MENRDFDLNLFKVLEALFEERSVGRAAARLGRTQSAISYSLRKLRENMEDPLFVRGSGGLVPTPRAMALEEQTRAIIRMTDTVLAGSEAFDPATARGRFRIGGPDRLGLPVILPFFRSVRALAPNTSLHLMTTDREMALSQLDADELDLVFGWIGSPPARFNVSLMFRESFACLCGKEHPILRSGEPLDLPAILSFPHLVVSVARDGRAPFDFVLAREGKERDVAVLVPHFLMVPSLLGDGQLIGVYTRRIAERLARDSDLVARPITAGVEPLDQYMIWHKRNDADPRNAWFRKQMELACRQV